MDGHLALVQNLALVLCVAAVTAYVFQRLHQPVVFGYLLAGLIIGPHLPVPLVADEEMVHAFAELGVILLLFVLGLEFRLRKLLEVGPTAGLIAVIQTSAMVLLGYLLGRAFGWTQMESIYTGAIIAISSTTIIVKAFAEQRLTGRFTEIVFGVLIIEDLIAILLLAILTTISAGGAVSASALGATAVRLGVFLAALIVVGLLVIPRVIRLVIALRRPELTLITATGICFLGALLAMRFGYSVALGAFIVGSLVAESGRARIVEHLVGPLRDVFGAVFFVSVGMLIEPALVLQHWLPVLLLTAAVILGKVVFVSLGAFLTGFGTRTSVRTGMSLAQIGEFSFIIAGIGLATGAIGGFVYPVAVAVSAITTLTTPWLIRISGPVASRIDRTLPKPLQTFAALYETWLERLRQAKASPQSRVRRRFSLLLLDAAVLAAMAIGVAVEFRPVVGYLERSLSWTPQAATAAILGTAILLALPLIFGFFRTARSLGEALALDVLPAPEGRGVDLAAAPRRALAVAIQLSIVVAFGVPLLAITQPFLPGFGGPALFLVVLVVFGIALWKSATNLQGHTRAGAQLIAAALSRNMTATVEHPVPTAVEAEAEASLAGIQQLLPGLGAPIAMTVHAEDFAVGRSLGELDLRSRTGGAILALTRAGQEILLPTGQDVLQAGDVLAVAGTAEAVQAATTLLRTGT